MVRIEQMKEESGSSYNPLCEYLLLDILGVREILLNGKREDFRSMMLAINARTSLHILNVAIGLDINTDDDLYRIAERIRHYTIVNDIPRIVFPFRALPQRCKLSTFSMKTLILSEGYIYEPCSEMRLILPRIGGTAIPPEGEEYYWRIKLYWEHFISDSARDIFGRFTGSEVG